MSIMTEDECYAIIANDHDADRRVKAARLLVLKANIAASNARIEELKATLDEIAAKQVKP
jgi:hypothetical protein